MRALGEIVRGTDIGYKSLGFKYVWHACEKCGKERWVRFIKGQPHHKLCQGCDRKGKRSNHWKGGRITKLHGYIGVWMNPDDFFYPMATRRGAGLKSYVMEHRLVMAKHLNRCLLPWEVVHHKNGIKDDNKLENLELLPSSKYHLIDLAIKGYIGKLEGKMEKQDEEIRLLRWQLRQLNESLRREGSYQS